MQRHTAAYSGGMSDVDADPSAPDRRGRGPRRRIDVVGSGRASATPDVVRLQLGLRADASDVASALRGTGDLVTALGAAAREQGVSPADISSSGAGVHPRYDRDGQRVVGYQSFHQLGVLVRATDRVSALVEAVAAVAGNALSIDAISLEIADTAALEQEARDAAFAHARSKAEQYAALSGARLGLVLAVTEGGVAARESRGRMKLDAVAMAGSASMPVEAGEHTVTATVTVSFAMESPEG